MAEIRVEPKRGRPLTWVLIVLIVLALVAWYVLSRRHPAAAPASGSAPRETPALARLAPRLPAGARLAA
jgi:hypothetical protein